jgi:Cu+-exporting ATPase
VTASAEKSRDPVCGMFVDPDGAHQHQHAGTLFRFCSAGCARRFRDDPESFLGQPKSAPAPAPSGTRFTCPMHPEVERDAAEDCPDCGMALEPILPVAAARWTCPMHPEIVQSEPGSCPICGMALEAMEAEPEENPELVRWGRRSSSGVDGPSSRAGGLRCEPGASICSR